VTDSRSPLLLRPPQGGKSESPTECRDPWGGEDKRLHLQTRCSMMVRLGGLGSSAYPMHPETSVGLGLRKRPLKGTPFWRPNGIHWMRSSVLYMKGCPS